MLTFATLPLLLLMRNVAGLTAGVALLLFFKPLLLGLGRALLLAVKPRLSKEERRARRIARDAQLLQKIINRASSPNDAAELRALAARA